MADNWVGWKVCQYLKEIGENIVGLAIHPNSIRNYGKEIVNSVGLTEEKIFVGQKNISKKFIDDVKKLLPDVILSVFWAYVLPPNFFDIPPRGCINFHCAYLPHNKGKNPNVWPIIDGTPAGVSLHYIDEGIDSGNIIAQRLVPVDITDNAKTLYQKLISTFVDLFKDEWANIKSNQHQNIKQNKKGTFHTSEDFKSLGEIDLDKKYTALELINLLRAKTFPPFPSAYFIWKNKKVYININLKYENDG